MAAAAMPWHGKSVLIVDDYPTVRKALREILLGLGLEVSEAENGLEAQEALKDRNFDLLITDLVMPEMDGFELTDALRSASRHRRIPIVVISTHDDAKYIFRALNLGADDYLVKPPSAEIVRVVLARIFDHEW